MSFCSPMALRVCTVAICCSLFAVSGTSHVMAAGEDWPNYRGPNWDGISKETGWRSDFGGGQPQVSWRTNIGIGYSSVAVQGSTVYAAGWRNGQDHIYALDAQTGKEIWKHSYRIQQYANMHNGGPGSTPLVHEGRIYVGSRNMQLRCLDASSGKEIWKKDLARQYGVREGDWGFTGSAIAWGNAIIIDAGKIIAFDKKTGKEIWATRDYGTGYSTPAPFSLGRRKLLASFPAHGLVVLDANSGREVAQRRWKTSYNVNAATPVILGNSIFVSSNYDVGGGVFRLDNRGLTTVWQNKVMRNHMNSSVLINGKLYGFDNAQLKCVDFRTGRQHWAQRGLGKGSLMAADGKIIVLSEKGELLIAPASDESFSPTTRMQVFNARGVWTVPVLSHGRIYCRAPGGELVCVDVSK